MYGRRFGESRFTGAVAGHAEPPRALVILHLDHDDGRVRSHSQWLVLAEDAQQAQEQFERMQKFSKAHIARAKRSVQEGREPGGAAA